MADHERVLELGREIRPYLPELVGDGAEAMDGHLARLLMDAPTPETAAEGILDALGAHPAAREWGASFLGTGLPPDIAELFQVDRGGTFEDLAGLGGPVSAPKYACPRGDYVWRRRYQGQDPPCCPTHDLALVLVRPGP